ncbi:hypothetical protein N7520_007292 [Penicillium odoratum]|uniref:uncharacterized protein n=1 Tax=Penicillium odoratum TaxID=1167516 RepID=UPI0025483BDB|nr:uncharacterized protein N7520_007292 [Penicillium odoratum]KAJ5760136.1 hypothetical protein N7520_007292 [Penicillium odoratum]
MSIIGKENGSTRGIIEAEVSNSRISLLPQGNHLRSLMTLLRDSNTSVATFADVTERVGDQLISAALDLLPVNETKVVSPTGAEYQGIRETTEVCGVSILRAGASLENAMRRGYTGPLSFGKLLIQRDESTSLPTLYYSKFPTGIASKTVFILEPMLATGGSACAAIESIKANGVAEENIIFINILASRHGISVLFDRFPSIRLVTAAIDEELTLSNHISPGLGDFGDRFYGTHN